jgi:hypothetical protein
MTRFPLAALLAVAPVLAAQQPAHSGRGVAHYGKWLSAALAVGFTALGAREHARSDEAFTELLQVCRANATDCRRSPDGTYANPSTEQLFQTSLDFDRRARVRLLAAQASVLLTAALFLADHGGRGNGPDNIPLHGFSVGVDGRGARVGLKLAL